MACPACTSLYMYIDTADEWGENQRQIIIVVDVEESSLKLFLAGKPCIFATVFNISIVAADPTTWDGNRPRLVSY